jgi:hypothetical protein
MQRLKELIQVIPPLLRKIPESEFSYKPAPNKWSKKEILGHLIDSAANNQQRFIRIQYEREPVIFYDQDQWNVLNYHQDVDAKHLIEFWTIYNKHLIQLASKISNENLDRKGVGKDGQPKTLGWYIEDYVIHMEHHLRQIVEYS